MATYRLLGVCFSCSIGHAFVDWLGHSAPELEQGLLECTEKLLELSCAFIKGTRVIVRLDVIHTYDPFQQYWYPPAAPWAWSACWPSAVFCPASEARAEARAVAAPWDAVSPEADGVLCLGGGRGGVPCFHGRILLCSGGRVYPWPHLTCMICTLNWLSWGIYLALTGGNCGCWLGIPPLE